MKKLKLDVTFFHNFHRSDIEIEAFLLYCVVSNGKNTKLTIRKIESFINELYERRENIKISECVELAKKNKLGKYSILENFFYHIAKNEINPNKLRTISVSELEEIPGMGIKNSRFFKNSTDSTAKYGVLDVFTLSFLQDFYKPYLKIQINKKLSRKNYLKYEEIYLNTYKMYEKEISLHDFDKLICSYYVKKMYVFTSIHNFLNKNIK